jgi:negative regulator of genetic competence, sporulation and motility
MLFWKVDEETIHCLINKDEISKMGYDLETINEDINQMESFLETIVENSREYIDWSTENGIQNFMARALPADHFLITITCTFQDEIIDRNIEQIRKMAEAFRNRVTEKRLSEIEALDGEDKEKAFGELAKDLYDICIGEIDNENRQNEYEGSGGYNRPDGYGQSVMEVEDSTTALESKGSGDIQKSWKNEGVLPDRKLVFSSLDEIITFAGILSKNMLYTSKLYKSEGSYVLLVRFDKCRNDSDAVHFILTAEEYGGSCHPIHYDEAYMLEHGKVLIPENALSSLASMVKR